MAIKTVQGLPEGYKPGLEGVIAGTSEISEVNADIDALIFRGYAAHELAEKVSFDEVAYLFFYEKLPTKTELDQFSQGLTAERSIPQEVIDVFNKLPKNANPMVTLQIGVALLHGLDPDPDKTDAATNLKRALKLVAKAPTLVSAWQRIKNGQDIIQPDPNLNHGANFFYMVTGKKPDPQTAKAFDSTMILYTEHGFNASTFSSLVTASTLSDIYSAVVSAIGTLKGPLHGGANEAAIQMLLEIGEEANAEAWLKEKLAKKEKIMGFGHRVYRNQDSRAPFMKKLAENAAAKVGDKKLFPLSCKIEELMKAEKKLFPNVDYHGAVFYYLLGLPPEVYTPIFAMSRMVGWTAHVIEQQKANRLIRPKSVYTGERGLSVVPIEER